MLKIGKRQLEVLEESSDAAYARDVARFIREDHAEAVSELEDAELLRRVTIGIDRAVSFGMEWDATISGFVAIMFEVSPTFDRQPAIERVLNDGRIPPDSRLEALWDRTTEEDWEEAERSAEDAEAFWNSAPLGAPRERRERG